MIGHEKWRERNHIAIKNNPTLQTEWINWKLHTKLSDMAMKKKIADAMEAKLAKSQKQFFRTCILCMYEYIRVIVILCDFFSVLRICHTCIVYKCTLDVHRRHCTLTQLPVLCTLLLLCHLVPLILFSLAFSLSTSISHVIRFSPHFFVVAVSV